MPENSDLRSISQLVRKSAHHTRASTTKKPARKHRKSLQNLFAKDLFINCTAWPMLPVLSTVDFWPTTPRYASANRGFCFRDNISSDMEPSGEIHRPKKSDSSIAPSTSASAMYGFKPTQWCSVTIRYRGAKIPLYLQYHWSDRKVLPISKFEKQRGGESL